MKKNNVKTWLKEFDHSRAWLARELDVAPKTVTNWLSSPRPIPDKAYIIIERLMEADRLRTSSTQKVSHTLTLEFSSDEFDQIEDAAHHANKKIRTWATDTLRELSSLDPKEIAEEITEELRLVAESEAESPVVTSDQDPYKPNGDTPHAS